MHNVMISLYKRANDITSKDVIPFDIFLDNIADGQWQKQVMKIRAIKDKKLREEEKKKMPGVTISGKFSERTDSKIERHSGYIGIDFDDQDPEVVKEKLQNDRYLVACFASISYGGACGIFKIVPDKHREAFQGLGAYLWNNYSLISDPTSINPSRLRFISWDSDIIRKTTYDVFKEYPKTKPPKKIDKIVFSSDDFNNLLQEITSNQLNIVEDYYTWYRVGMSIVSKFGEDGRSYMHTISQYSSKYDPYTLDKHYDAWLKHHQFQNKGNDINIATFYYHCKEAGLNIYSEKTMKIAYSAIHGKKGGLSQEAVAENLEKFEQIENDENTQSIIEQVFTHNIELKEGSEIEQIKMWLRQNYSIEFNVITKRLEIAGKPLEKREKNSIWVKACSVFEKLRYDDMKRVIESDLFPEYNPFLRFFAENSYQASGNIANFDFASGERLPIQQIVAMLKNEAPLIYKLASAINTPDPDYCFYFLTKWLIGIISSIHGEYSSLCPVLCGEKVNTGKTEYWRRLLPKEWHNPQRIYPDYYAESDLDRGKDDDVLMSQKVVIMDDEFGGKSKKDSKKFKKQSSVQTFSLRVAYGEDNIDIIRIASLCGTSNEKTIIVDPSTNRRIIPIYVNSINHKQYNEVNKTDLFLEAYRLWKQGLRWRLEADDIQYLAEHTSDFEVVTLEEELILKYFKTGTHALTASEIKVHIEHKTNQRLSLEKLGQYLSKIGFEKKSVYREGGSRRCYMVDYVTDIDAIIESIPSSKNIPENDENVPF